MTPNPTVPRTEKASASPDRVSAGGVAAASDDVLRRRARAAHPSGQSRRQAPVAPPYYPPYRRPAPSVPAGLLPEADGPAAPASTQEVPSLTDEDGSLVTEYGLLAVVAATVAGVVIQWASGGALVTLFNALLRHARSLVGA